MASKSETVLIALFDALSAALPSGAGIQRNGVLPVRIPAAGQIILRDGDPGQPEVLMSPVLYYYEHSADVEIIVDRPATARDATFDTLKQAVGAALAADRTLGGLCDYVDADAPAPVTLPVENGDGLKVATISVTLRYGSADPLL
ncbi:hypothetical protein [Paenirhodobacter enshiensis]|uniref:Acyl-CoA transferase n=1 Tax=Paenirhodobacter enshiensis TaxID=1105367 RepID=A0A086XQQ3_9RHOB|nr:hypothetical protein [Paenirhodobacter enshiensis]KFI24353.1 acyl-CoA transferase [Paenirhodobacter enshiensis]